MAVIQRRERRWVQEEEEMDGEDKAVEDEYDKMLLLHEIVARASTKDSPVTTFSMLEGVRRTLRGRDLRRVRNTILRQTEGFVGSWRTVEQRVGFFMLALLFSWAYI